MTSNQTTTETVTADEIRDRFEELLSRALGRDQRVVIKRDGKPVAALISFADLERFDLLIKQRERSFEVLDRIGQAFAGVSEEEIEREANKAVAEVRAEMRARRQSETVLNR